MRKGPSRCFRAASATGLAGQAIEEGLVCTFSVLQPCRTFSFRFQPAQAYAQSIFATISIPLGNGTK